MKLEIFFILSLSYCVSTIDKDNDEGRPYEFGFTIDGQQHRHESKDVNGIVNGEFGFITADGIYHVTVYATDENGNFKILSMRNVRVSGPLDEPGYEFPKKTPSSNPQTHEKLIEQPETIIATTTTQASTTNNAPYKFTTIPSLNVPSCGSCKLPSTTPRPPGVVKEKLPFQTPAFQAKPPVKQPELVDNTRKQAEPIGDTLNPVKQPESVDNTRKQAEPISDTLNQPHFGTEELIDKRFGNGELETFGETLPENYEPIKPSIEQQPPHFENPNKNDVINNIPNTRAGKQFNIPEKIQEDPNNPIPPGNQDILPRYNPDILQEKPVESFKPSIPITVSNQQINIPGRDPIPIKDPYPNMVDGLPSGITENDMLDLLYKFNYTLGFHGHHEKGLKNGAKVGAYFVNGRDGISRVVEYIADENGYRPKVKFINLGYDSPDTPKEDTEKTFGLKGYEFTWYPI